MQPKKLIFSILFLLIGLAILVFGTMRVFEASATENWTRIEGESLEAVAIRQTGSKKTYPYEVRVRYAYEVDGQAHEGDRYDVHGSFKAKSAAQAEGKVTEWAAGSPVTVFVDPGDPEAAVLATGGGGRAWLLIAMGGLLSFGGVFAALVRTRRR